MAVGDWFSRMSDRTMDLMVVLRIRGIEPVFCSRAPLTGAGAAITTCTHTEGAVTATHTVLTALHIPNDFAIQYPTIDPTRGIAAPSSVMLTLVDDRTDAVLKLFRPEGDHQTIITASVDYADVAISVASTTGFPGTGTIYPGAEGATYTGTTAVSFTGLTRGCFGSFAHSYSVDPTRPFTASRIADYPGSPVGRYADIFVVPLTQAGAVYGDTLLNDYAVRIFSGIIRSCVPDERWASWSLEIQSPESVFTGEGGTSPLTSRCATIPIDPSSSLLPSTVFCSRGQVKIAAMYMVDGETTTPQIATIALANTFTSGSAWVESVRSALYTASLAAFSALSTPPPSIAAGTFVVQWVSGIVAGVADGCGAFRIGNVANSYRAIWYNDDESYSPAPYDEQQSVSEYPSGNIAQWQVKNIASIDISLAATKIPHVDVQDGLLASGYVQLNLGDVGEIIRYSSITASVVSTVNWLNIYYPPSGRGRAGTTPRSWRVVAGAVQVRDADSGNVDSITMQNIAVLSNSLTLNAMQLTTGTPEGVHGTYDTLGYGLGVPPAYIEDWSEGESPPASTSREWPVPIDKPLGEVIADETLWEGRCIVSRLNDAGMSMRMSNAYLYNGFRTVNSSNILWMEAPRYVSVGRPINKITAHLRYDPIADEWVAPEVTVQDLRAIADQARVQELELQTRRYHLPSWTDDIVEVDNRAARLFYSMGRPRYRVRMGLVRSLWGSVWTGSILRVYYDGVPAPDGTRGLSDARMQIISCTYGIGPDAPPLMVEAEFIPSQRARQWSPTFRVTAVNDGAAQVTIANTEFFPTGSSESGEAGDKVLFVRGGYTTTAARTISSVSGATVTLTLALGWADTDDIYMIYNDYASASSAQQIGTTAWQTGTGGLVGAVEGGKWL